MSLHDDLMRNRRVFEILTGKNRGDDEPYRLRAKNIRNADVPQTGRETSGFAMQDSAAGDSRARAGASPPGEAVRGGFSLNYGSVNLPAGFTELPGVGSVTYPEIKPEVDFSAPQRIDPLESMYDRMETQARMTSQLSREEGFFGF